MGKSRALVLAGIVAVIIGAIVSGGPAPADHTSGEGPYVPNTGNFVDFELTSATSGYVLNANGVVQAFGTAPPVVETPNFGFAIARALSLTSDETSGYVLSGWGSLHPWAAGGAPLPPNPTVGPYWPGWDIARDFVHGPTNRAGFVLSGWGSIHRWGTGEAITPLDPDSGPYWPGMDIARDIEVQDVNPDGTGAGLILDGWGGLHNWSTFDADDIPAQGGGPYWPGWHIARDFELDPDDNTQGWIVSGWGSNHVFGAPIEITDGPYWPGWDIARDLETPGCDSSAHLQFLVLDGWAGRHSAHATDYCV